MKRSTNSGLSLPPLVPQVVVTVVMALTSGHLGDLLPTGSLPLLWIGVAGLWLGGLVQFVEDDHERKRGVSASPALSQTRTQRPL